MSPPAAQPPSTIAVIGLGSIGGIAAGCLLTAGLHDLFACVRRPLQSLTLDRPGSSATLPLRALTSPDAAQPVDWVLVCTKTHETEAIGPWLQRLCGPATRVAVLQNGLGHAERVAPFIGGAAVVPAIVYYNGERLAPDHVRLTPVGERDVAVSDDATGRAFAALFDGTPLRVATSAEFTTLLWRKLLINAAANPMTALTRQRQAVLRRPDIHALCLTVLGEAVAVGRAEGAALAEDEAERIMAALLTYAPGLGTSMYFDTLAGRPLEADAILGAIVAAGERHGIPTPCNQTLLTLLRAISDAAKTAG
ncbi:2-dehydropantoate 2-reductase [Roseomonas hellenica]|uniref:2-dehydropantoate 2-reductase n=1 Tax=Plastoroseomonas hellenica TaxID=2687306 RepID=A0ABS5EVH9_9PROT|nr:2-dehydropantoate 2-reductase [Plastoroseomonas hellenica]MBR0664302.1 2-dehydropantoate 2-reductase [Plastoroseomonas hellenica]